MSSLAINGRLLGALRRPKAKAPVRIGVTGLRGIPNVMGGIETHCEQLLPRLKGLRPDYEVIVMGRSPYLARGSIYRGVDVRRLFTIRNKYLETILHTFVSILYARFVLRCGFVHIHGIGPSLLAPLATLVGLKVVVTHHGEDYNRDKWNQLARTMLRWGEFLSVRYSKAVLVVSNDVSSRLKGRHASHFEKIHFVPNGASDLRPGSDGPSAADILDRVGLKDKRYILGVGRLVPEKNFDILVDAFRKADLDCELVIAGAADHGDSYSAELLKKAGTQVRFIGFQSRETLAALYQHAALFVLPSSHEGMPIAALEAAAAGCPILLSDIVPNVEIGLEPKNYFAVGRVDALAQKLIQPFDDFHIDAKAVSETFDWDKVAERTATIYDRALIAA